jgi:hypothetical protein
VAVTGENFVEVRAIHHDSKATQHRWILYMGNSVSWASAVKRLH